MHLISQSEVDSYLSCQMKHFFAFGMPIITISQDGKQIESHGIAAKEHSESLTRGIIGHEGLAAYYLTAATKGHEAGKRAALTAVLNYDTSLVEIKTQVVRLLNAYFDYYEYDLDEWEPVAIEQEFRWEAPGTDLVFPFKPDAVMRNKLTGKVYIWDHKFLYNYYQDRVYPLMPQLKKYGWTLRALGFRVDGYIYNQISTRANSKEPFRRTEHELGPSAEKFMDDQVSAMQRIAHMKSLPPAIWKESAIRNASSFSCSHCPFLDICTMELDEDNGLLLHVKSYYGPNKYGYGKEED